MWKQILGGAPDGEVLQAAFRFALSLCQNEHDAEDLVQQAVLKLCRRYGSIKNQQLMFTTIRNLFYDNLRRERVVAFESMDSESAAELPDDSISDQLWKVDLESALEVLHENERELIYLNKVEGYSAKEISRITGEPRGTVLWRLANAMKKLKSFCEKEEAATRAESSERKTQ